MQHEMTHLLEGTESASRRLRDLAARTPDPLIKYLSLIERLHSPQGTASERQVARFEWDLKLDVDDQAETFLHWLEGKILENSAPGVASEHKVRVMGGRGHSTLDTYTIHATPCDLPMADYSTVDPQQIGLYDTDTEPADVLHRQDIAVALPAMHAIMGTVRALLTHMMTGQRALVQTVKTAQEVHTQQMTAVMEELRSTRSQNTSLVASMLTQRVEDVARREQAIADKEDVIKRDSLVQHAVERLQDTAQTYLALKHGIPAEVQAALATPEARQALGSPAVAAALRQPELIRQLPNIMTELISVDFGDEESPPPPAPADHTPQ